MAHNDSSPHEFVRLSMNDGSSPVVDSDMPQELPQDIKLVVQNGNETIQILLKGHVIVRNSGSPQSNGGDAAGQGTAATTIGQRQAGAGSDSDSDDDYLQNMRGWLMAAATLFLGMAYQAATKPPAWMPSAKDAFDVYFFGKKVDDPAAAGSVITKERAQRAVAHLFLNTIVYAISLALVVLLPTMNKATPRSTWRLVNFMVLMLALIIAINLCNAISDDILIVNVVMGVIGVYACTTILYIQLYPRMGAILVQRTRSLLAACLPAVPRLPATIHSKLSDQQQVLLS